MASRRDLIKMTEDEVAAYLALPNQVMNVASIGKDGRPHLVAMWYGSFHDGSLGFWTFNRSQKVVNLRRDPRITCLVESGDVYSELRGVEIEGTVTLSETPADIIEIGRSVISRYPAPGAAVIDPATIPDDVVLRAGNKRTAVRIHVEKVVSWDHRKLGGTY